MQRNIELTAEDLDVAIRELRNWGFRIVREPLASDDQAKQEYDSRLAACSLLGLEQTQENMRLEAVNRVARVLLRNAMQGA